MTRPSDPDQFTDRRGVQVFLNLFGHGAWLVIAGLVLGVIAAFGLRPIASTLLFGVTPSDPLTYLTAAAAFSGVGLAAIIIPARRASLVEPINALPTSDAGMRLRKLESNALTR